MTATREPARLTRLLEDLREGNAAATDEVLQLVYSELRVLARGKLNQEADARTWQPTALVHEAYLRLVDQRDIRWESRAHFFAAASEAMRRILVEEARKRRAVKRGRGVRPVELLDVPEETQFAAREDLIALDEALSALGQIDHRKMKLVELRYFAGLSEQDAADVLGISRPTAARWWAFSKAWLFDRLRSPLDEPGDAAR